MIGENYPHSPDRIPYVSSGDLRSIRVGEIRSAKYTQIKECDKGGVSFYQTTKRHDRAGNGEHGAAYDRVR